MAGTLSEHARIALEKAIQQGGQVRLIAKGAKAPGLFPGGKSKDVAGAIEECRTGGLIDVKEIEEKKGKKTEQYAAAVLTLKGAVALFRSVPAVQRTELLKRASDDHRRLAEEALAETCRDELEATRAELSSVLAKEEEIAEQLKAILDHRRRSLTEARERLTRTIQETQEALSAVPDAREIPVNEAAGGAPQLPEPRRRAEPRDEKDLDFQRDQCEQLVFAWKDASHDEAKMLLEGVMFNLGVEQLGERGQQIPFDQTTQEIDQVAERGEPVEVIEPGWRLSNARGVYLISPTQVRKLEAQSHEAHDLH